MNPVSTSIFVIGTLLITAISRKSLFHPRSHGFYRFFAWEGILLLAIFNVPSWLDDPLSFRQICSWLLLTASLYPVAYGTFLLHVVGKPSQTPSLGTDLAFEQTTNLVTTGIYKYIRHPLYASLLYLTWGIHFKEITWLTTVLAIGVSVFLYATAQAEEKENNVRFGEKYTLYASRTKMFIPYIW